jgi:REP element-mobilizing transposase RayT
VQLPLQATYDLPRHLRNPAPATKAACVGPPNVDATTNVSRAGMPTFDGVTRGALPYDNEAGDIMRLYNRHSIRLHNYNYTQPGAYFVTLCTHERECLLGNITDGTLRLGPLGLVIEECWQALPRYFHAVELDAFVIMPNHVHGIICIVDTPHADAAPSQQHGSAPGSLTAIVGTFKAISARRINQLRGTPGAAVWQRNYYEHIIRTSRELEAVRKYIVDNPLKWSMDHENPAASM